MKQSPASHRIHGLDTLRALAIVLVFMNHYVLFVKEGTFGFLGDIGWVGVDLFFGLSGYLIGNQIFAALRNERGFSLKNFYARRLLRTLPNFYFVLALYFLWPAFQVHSAPQPLWTFLTFTQNLLLTPGTIFSHAWSLCVEEQFYMVLPAVALLFAAGRHSLRLAWVAIAACIVAGMLVRAYLWQHYVAQAPGGREYYTYIYYFSLCRCDELVAGVALALLKNYHADLWTRITAHGNRTFGAGLAVSALAWYLFLDNRYGFGVAVFGYPLLAVGVTLLIIAALSPASLLRTTRVPGAASLALWSYAIYLLHKSVCIMLNPVLAQQGWAPGSVTAVLLSTAASVLAGWLLFRLVETPFMTLRDRYVPSNAAHPPALKLAA